jgi:hypothetical protein
MQSPVPPQQSQMQISPSQRRHIHQAKVLRGMASASQVVVMIALFVLWRERGMSFRESLEICLVLGVAIYMVLFGIAAVILVVSRLEPVALLVGPAIRLVSLVIYATLRFGQNVHWFTSILILFVLYVGAWIMVRRIERHARRRFGW